MQVDSFSAVLGSARGSAPTSEDVLTASAPTARAREAFEEVKASLRGRSPDPAPALRALQDMTGQDKVMPLRRRVRSELARYGADHALSDLRGSLDALYSHSAAGCGVRLFFSRDSHHVVSVRGDSERGSYAHIWPEGLDYGFPADAGATTLLCGKAVEGADLRRGPRGGWLSPRMTTGGQSGWQCPSCETAVKYLSGSLDAFTASYTAEPAIEPHLVESVLGETRERCAKRPPFPRHLHQRLRKDTISALTASLDDAPADPDELHDRARDMAWKRAWTLLSEHMAANQAGVLRRLKIPVSAALDARLRAGDRMLTAADFSDLLCLLDLAPGAYTRSQDTVDAASAYSKAVAARLRTRRRSR